VLGKNGGEPHIGQSRRAQGHEGSETD
jgi:hypothetical protein